MWQIYQNTLNNIFKNEDIYMQMMIYYYNLIINNKLADIDYIKNNFHIKDSTYEIFNEYIVMTKNIGIFTLFNNIPDILHPLESDYYYNYGMYISFINPKYFKINNSDIIILKDNIWKHKMYFKPSYQQDISPYNINKKYLYINMKFFNYVLYKNYVILATNENKETYILDNNIVKQKNKNKWEVINNFKFENNKWLYVSLLRKINKEDLLNVFNEKITLEKNSYIYSYHKENTNQKRTFLSFENYCLADPYHIFYQENDMLYQYKYTLLKDITPINLSTDILSNNKLLELRKIKVKSLFKVLNENKMLEQNKNDVFSENLNYIKYYETNDLIWNNNRGKRLLHEILFKTSNFIDLRIYYFEFLNRMGFNYFIYNLGFYDKLNKYYGYEMGFSDFYEDIYKLISVKQIKFGELL